MPSNERRIYPSASIIIPAHNEQTVIKRCIDRVRAKAKDNEFEIIVVCNGCHDDTENQARKAAPDVIILTTSKQSKTNAVNLGNRRATKYPRIYLDADIEVTASELRELLRPIKEGVALATAGRMTIDDHTSSYFVRAFYRVWQHVPYLDHGKFGGVYALSESACKRIGTIPELTCDDEYVRRQLEPHERQFVETACFTMKAPRRVSDLIKIRQRSIRGTSQLSKAGHVSGDPAGFTSLLCVLRRIAARPRLWRDLPVFISISLWIRYRAWVTRIQGTTTWERDDTSRVSPST